MEERIPGKQKRGSLVWLLVLLAVVLVWVFFRPAGHTTDDSTTDATAANDPVAAAEADPDDILVDLRDDVSDADVAKLESAVGIHLVLVSSQSKDERFYRAHVDPAREAEIIDQLQARSDVEIAEPDAMYALSPIDAAVAPLQDRAEDPWTGFPNDPKYRYQWHLDQIHMPAAWKLSGGDGVVVAVLDTGVAYEAHGKSFHQVPDLAGVKFHKPYNFVDNNEHANDDHGHGTHVSGTIAQATHNGVGVAGVARNATIMPLKVLSGRGSGSVAGIADAIHYAADEGAQVINMSLGGRFPSKVLEKAVKYAHDKGVTVICAAGNDGRGKVSYPAAYAGSVAVAATQYDETTTFYSNWGAALDVAAPGGNTRVDQNGDGQPDGVLQNTIVIGDPTKDDYFAYMGTSMASPHAAGVAALVVAQGVTQPDAVEKIMEDTARAPKGRQLDKKHYGAGILDAEAAILKARGQSGAAELALGALLAGVVAFSIRRRGALVASLARTSGWVGLGAGVLFGASGLFFLPYLSGALASLPVLSTLTRGLPSWDLSILGPDGHGNALFFSALIPLGLVALGSGVGRLRLPLAGLCLGVAGHLLFTMAAGWTDVRWMMWDGLWLSVNAALLVGVAHLTMRR